MSSNPLGPLPSIPELRDLCQTLTGVPVPKGDLPMRLQFIADLIADAGPLPTAPILLWRDPKESSVHHVLIGSELIVGRQVRQVGLTLPGDKLLSRRHFAIRRAAEEFSLEDLKSHNGTAVNRSDNRVPRVVLRDGDLILAGANIFVFLKQGQTV